MQQSIKPFLKWAGGKYRILDRVLATLPPGRRLIEPFAGSAVVFLNTNYEENLIADSNPDLINLYQQIQLHGIDFIDYVESLFIQNNNDETVYYELRNEFNTTQNIWRKSALFIYLNRHCFNGLCRYNSKGGFNVPFGRYAKPYFPKEELINFHRKCKVAVFELADYRTTMAKADANSVVYCDPPYAPLTDTANFTSYTQAGFSLEDQCSLAKIAEQLLKQKIPVVISNHDTAFTREVYSKAFIQSFDVQRFIASKAINRVKAAELLAVFHQYATIQKY